MRVTVEVGARVAAHALSSDARFLALATYAVNEDYGTGFDARLELVDLTTGARRTVHGEGSGIRAVRGRARTTCAWQVYDPSSDLNVRASPSARAEVRGTLSHGTRVEVAERRGSWSRLASPTEGWVWDASVRRVCVLVE